MPAAPATQPRPKIGIRLRSLPQAEPVDQPRVDRRRRDAGDGDEEERVDVVGAEAGLAERREQRLAADLLGDADPGVVGGAEGR